MNLRNPVSLAVSSPSPQRHIQHYHQVEAHGEEHCTDVGVRVLGHLRDQLLHHIKHGSGGKAEQIGWAGTTSWAARTRLQAPPPRTAL